MQNRDYKVRIVRFIYFVGDMHLPLSLLMAFFSFRGIFLGFVLVRSTCCFCHRDPNGDRVPSCQEQHSQLSADMLGGDLRTVLEGLVAELFGEVECTVLVCRQTFTLEDAIWFPCLL
jgi:hypothetical protein